MDELKEATDALDKAVKARTALERKISDERRAAMAAVDAAHDVELRQARSAEYAARTALDAVKDRQPDHPLVGRRVFMVKAKRYGSVGVRTEGVVEMCRTTTVFPANAASYSIPSLGKPFVRHLKADGTPGMKFEKFNYNDDLPHPWKLADA